MAAILWLGNVEFVSSDATSIAPGAALQYSAALLGVSEQALSTALTSRSITTGSERIVTPLNQQQVRSPFSSAHNPSLFWVESVFRPSRVVLGDDPIKGTSAKHKSWARAPPPRRPPPAAPLPTAPLPRLEPATSQARRRRWGLARPAESPWRPRPPPPPQQPPPPPHHRLLVPGGSGVAADGELQSVTACFCRSWRMRVD